MENISETKLCPKCGSVKSLSEFHKDSSKKDSHSSYCKLCSASHNAAYRIQHKQTISARKKKNYSENREEILENMRIEYAANPEKKKENRRIYYQNNREEVLEWHKTYREGEGKDIISARIEADRKNNPWRLLINTAKARAKKKDIPFSLLPEDVSVPEVCPVLGLFLLQGEGTLRYESPTLDRLIPELGYVRDNIAVISMRANAIKSIGTAEEHRAVADWMDGLHAFESDVAVPDKTHAKSLINNARTRAKEHNIPFSIRMKDLKIPALCPVFGIPMFRGEGKVCWNSPTIDRVIPESGYAPENIAIISHRANTIKNTGTAAEHRKIADWMDSILAA